MGLGVKHHWRDKVLKALAENGIFLKFFEAKL